MNTCFIHEENTENLTLSWKREETMQFKLQHLQMLNIYQTFYFSDQQINFSKLYIYRISICLSSINILCMFVCFFESNKPKPIRPKFLWDLAWPQGMFLDFQKFASKFDKIRFLKILKSCLTFTGKTPGKAGFPN